METLKINVEASNKNFVASYQSKDINGTILVTAKTFSQVKKEFISAFNFHIKSCLDDHDNLPNYIINKKYVFVFKMNTTASLLHIKSLLGTLATTKITGLDSQLLNDYLQGSKQPEAQQIKAINQTLHKIGTELLSVKL